MPWLERHPWAGWALCFVAITAALLWPALINGRPAYFPDSAGYHRDGRAFIETVRRKALHEAPAAASKTALTTAEIGSTRAVVYSLFAWLTAGENGTMAGTIAVQAALAAIMLLIWLRRAAPGSGWRGALLAGLALAAFSTAAWTCSFAMPDVFAGLALLAVLTLALPDAQPLAPPARAFSAAMIALAVASHASHILLVGTLIVFLAMERLWTRRRGTADWTPVVWVSGAFAAGVAIVLLTSLAGFSQVSLAPKRLPFLLARSIEDGPSRRYLKAHCAQARYVICGLYPTLPRRSAQLLFDPGNLTERATPAQMDAIRAEELPIVVKATMAYPLEQLAAWVGGLGRQLVWIGLDDTDFRWRAWLGADGALRLARTGEPVPLHRLFNVVIAAGFLASVAWLVRSARRGEAGAAASLRLLAFALLADAAITSMLSAAAERYQERVVWVVSAAALGLALGGRGRRGTAGISPGAGREASSGTAEPLLRPPAAGPWSPS